MGRDLFTSHIFDKPPQKMFTFKSSRQQQQRTASFHFTTNRISARHPRQTASDASASPELVLVCFDDLALQFEGLLGEQLEVSDVV